jgi:hypothetical protein
MGEEVVRYDRAGKWYIELVEPSPDAPARQRVSLRAAARRAAELVDMAGTVHWGRPGGSSFDLNVRRLLRDRSETP